MKRVASLLLGLAAVALLAIPMTASAQGPTGQVTMEQVQKAIDAMDKQAQQEVENGVVPGLAIAVVFEDKVVFSKGYGVREVGKSDKIDADTTFQLASVSKPVGATVVAELVGEGKISWDSKLSDLDPAFQMFDPWVTNQITIRDMYAHRSGLPEHTGDLAEDMGYDRAEVLHRLRYQPPDSSFRSHYNYTNFGMTEAAVAAAKAYGLTWEDASQQKLYEPLGMTQTSSRYSDFEANSNKAVSHVLVDGKWQHVEQRQPDAQSPAGGVSSSANDMAKWLRLQLANGKFDGKQIVDEKALLETRKPQMLTGFSPSTGLPSFYGLGVITGYDDKGRPRLNHSGGFVLGGATVVTMYPSEQLGIVVLSNAAPIGEVEAIAQTFTDTVEFGKPTQDWFDVYHTAFKNPAIVGIATNADYTHPPSPPTPAKPNSSYVGTYANDFFGDIEILETDGGLAVALGPNKITRPMTHYDRDIFTYETFGENASIGPSGITFTLGPDGKATQVLVEALNVDGEGTFLRTGAGASLTTDIRKQLDAEIEKQMASENLPSVAVSILVPGEEPYTFAKGQANLETGRARELTDPFRIASITKTFIGLTTLILADEGKLSLTDTLAKWYPAFPNADKITVDDLLRMRSGIPDAFDEQLAQQYYDNPLINFGAEDMIARSAAKASEFKEPNKETAYTNVNTILLQRIIEKVTGDPIQDVVAAKILTPLKLSQTVYPTDSAMPGDLHGYSWNADSKEFQDKTTLNPALPGGAGAMISTVADLNTFVRALCQGTLLKPETHANQLQAHTLAGSPDWVKYGENIGLFGNFCGHTGTIFGSSTDMFYLPQLDATVIVNVNRLDLDDHSKSIPIGLALEKIAFPDYVSW